MRKNKLAVLFLLCLLVLGGISPLLTEVTGVFKTLHNLYHDALSGDNDGDGGGPGWPNGGGGGS